jgi:hypothetical protein
MGCLQKFVPEFKRIFKIGKEKTLDSAEVGSSKSSEG